eukprot:2203752-Prymnesium_polylepis.1
MRTCQPLVVCCEHDGRRLQHRHRARAPSGPAHKLGLVRRVGSSPCGATPTPRRPIPFPRPSRR